MPCAQTRSVSSSSSHTHHLTLTHHRRLLTQTLTTLYLWIQSNRRQRSPIHRRCLAEKHGQSLPPHTLTISPSLTIDAFSHRHSPHSISETIKSARKEPNPSPMPCAQTRSVSSSSSHTHHLTLTHHRRLLTQTLTTLHLWRQSNRRERSPIHRRCLAHKHGQSLPPPHTLTISPSLTIDAFSHRHSPHSISRTIKSAKRVQNVSRSWFNGMRTKPSHNSSHGDVKQTRNKTIEFSASVVMLRIKRSMKIR